MLQAGTLDRRVSIQRKTEARDAHGQPIETWSQIGRPRWAAMAPVDRLAERTEQFASRQFIASEQIEFKVRWTRDLQDLSPEDRIIYPITSNPEDWQIYEIMTVHEIGRYAGLSILTARRSETTT